MDHLIDQKQLNILHKTLWRKDIPIGDLPQLYWSEDNPIKSHLTPLVIDTQELLKTCTEEEINALLESFHHYLRRFVIRNSAQELNLELIALALIINELHNLKTPLKEIIDGDLDKSEVLNVYPELREKIDKYGLLELTGDFKLTHFGIEYKDHFLLFHQFLRKGFSNSMNLDFVWPFAKYFHKSNRSNKFWIAIDHTRIVLKSDFQERLELDTWHGPKFSIEDLDNPKITGLTVVARNPGYLLDPLGHLKRTEFLWSFKNGIKSLQIEEIVDKEGKLGNYYLTRYVHAERDTEKQVLQHFDGAVKIYYQQNYPKRFDQQLSHDAKGDKKIKLFRIDGDIDLDLWIELIGMFYRGNEMIVEYFDPGLFEEKYKM